jgi:hypothetical protein
MKQLPEYLLGLTYEIDGRTPNPNEVEIKARLVRFRVGWADALEGEEYEASTLSELKW